MITAKIVNQNLLKIKNEVYEIDSFPQTLNKVQ
jgi:hypothetical protein